MRRNGPGKPSVGCSARGGLALAGVLLALGTAAGAPLRDTDVVARVNGTPIYRKAVREVVQGVLLAEDSKPDATAVNQLAHDALDSLISLELLYQESETRGIKVSDADVDAEIARNKRNFPSAAAFASLLKAKGMTSADLRRDTRKTMAVNRLLEGTVLKDVEVTEAQITAFYDHNREVFRHPAQIRASHILIRVAENAPADARAAARQQAAALLAQLKAGADFAQLARQRSQDPVTAERGGDLGYFAEGDMDEAFEKAAFALAPGQLSDVVATPYGFHIIKVTGKRPAGYAPLAEVHDRIRELLLKRARQRKQAQFVAGLRRKARVEIVQPAAP
jgi:peptidyl-prolyl cis-trans isomerase C